MVLSTNNARALEELTGLNNVLQVVGRREDLDALVRAVNDAMRSEPKSYGDSGTGFGGTSR